MKNFLYTLFFLAVSLCAHSQCSIDTSIQQAGFHPDTGSYLPKACAGSHYDAVIQIYAPQNVTIALGTFAVNYVQLDSIPALPANMSYSTNPTVGKMNGGERGCINVYGLVNIAPGDYAFTIYYTANFTAFGGPVSLGFMAPYKLHVDTGSATFSNASDTVCEYPGYNLGDKWLTASGTYMDTLMATSGCDSIVTLQLSVIPFNLSVSPVGNSLHAAPGMESYQWYDCDEQAIVSDETDSIFTPGTVGNYSVMVSNGECSGTSECFMYTGIREPVEEWNISVQPNPTKSEAILSLPQLSGLAVIQVLLPTGQVMWQQVTTESMQRVNLQALPSGLYFITVKSGNKSGVCKLLNQ